MNTFLPYPSFSESARVLDRARLGKQRVEVLQILRALRGLSKGWVNHPATRMWRGYEFALADYGILMCVEWFCRGYKDTCASKIAELGGSYSSETPPWLGVDVLHSSHRANLLRKDPIHYGKWGWTEAPVLGYYWPVTKEK